MSEANAVNEHYNADYFKWQQSLGEFGGKANLRIYEEFIRPEHRIFDFGAGGARRSKVSRNDDGDHPR